MSDMINGCISYSDKKKIGKDQLERLFLELNWSSGRYPEKLEKAVRNYATVFSAWRGEELVGLICAMDDGVMTAYIHYLLVSPKWRGFGIGGRLIEMVKKKYGSYLRIVLGAYNEAVDFYKKFGFKEAENETVMFLTSMPD